MRTVPQVRRFAIVAALVAAVLGVTGFALAAPSLFVGSSVHGSDQGDLVAWVYDAEDHTLVYWLTDGDETKCDAVLEGGADIVVDGCNVLTAEGPAGRANHGAAVSQAVAQLKAMEGLAEPLGQYVRDLARSSVGMPWHPAAAESVQSNGQPGDGPPDHAGGNRNGNRGRGQP